MSKAPKYVAELKDRLSRAVERLEKTFPFAQAVLTEADGLSIRVSDKSTDVSSQPPRRGIVLSVFNGSYFAELATSDVSEDSINKQVVRLIEKVPVVAGSSEMDPGDAWSGDFFSSMIEDPRKLSGKAKIEHLAGLHEMIKRQSPRVVTAMIRYREHVDRRIYVNRNKQLFQELLNTQVIPVAIVSDGKSTKVHHSGNGIQGGFENARFSDADMAELVRDSERLLTAKAVQPGEYEVVAGPPLSGVIAHEAFGHGVESDMFLRKRAKAMEFIGKEVASSIVDLFDSPELPGLSGSYFFDDEGQPASKTQIIEKGILRQVLTEQRSALELNLPRTANGRRESYANKVYTRMSNTYFGAGEHTVAQMIESIDSGLYMPDGSNGMEDPKSWGIQVESPFAIEIRNGKLTDKVFAPIVITGFVPELLKSITMTGDKVGFNGLGVCQKGHKEQVRVAIGGSALKMTARVG